MRILISVILCHFFILALSQNKTPVCIWDKSEVDGLSIDISSSKIRFGNGRDTYIYDGQNIKEDDYVNLIKQDPFSLDANALTIKDQKLVLPSTINDAVIEKDSVLFIATESGLYYSKIPVDIVAQKVHVEEITKLGAIANVAIVDQFILMTTEDQLVLWDRKMDRFIHHDIKVGKINELLLDEYGLLWIATSEGLFRYELIDALEDALPKVQVKTRDGKALADTTLIEIDKGDQMVFIMDATHLRKPEALQSYAHLEGEGINKITPVKDGIHVLEKLDAGNYTIQFSANLDGRKDARFSKIQKIRVYERGVNYWWYIFGGIGILGLFTLIGNLRNQQFQKGILSQRDLLLAENKALKSEQQSLRLQMNPHFIFNVLNSINGMIAIGDTKKARKNINQFSQLMRSVLNHSRTEYISLGAEIKYLNEYLSLEKVTRNDSFEYEIIVDEQLDVELKTLPMIIQPFVENAIVHAFQGIDRSAQIKIELVEQSGYLEVTVQDNGRGRKASAISKKTEHQSIGLQVVSDRLLDPYGYEIQDLENSAGVALGTRVVIKMPLK